MKNHYQIKQVIPILTILLGIILGIVTNIATNAIPEFLTPYLWIAWPTLIIFSLVYLILQIWSQRNGESFFQSRGEKYANVAIEIASAPIPMPDTKSLISKISLFPMLKKYFFEIDWKRLKSPSYRRQQWQRLLDVLIIWETTRKVYKERIIPIYDNVREWQMARNHVQHKLKNGIITQEVADQAIILIDKRFRKYEPTTGK